MWNANWGIERIRDAQVIERGAIGCAHQQNQPVNILRQRV
jgi:hypothetical protein